MTFMSLIVKAFIKGWTVGIEYGYGVGYAIGYGIGYVIGFLLTEGLGVLFVLGSIWGIYKYIIVPWKLRKATKSDNIAEKSESR